MLLNVTEFKYLGKTLMDQDYMREERKTTLNLGNVCYCPVLYLLSSHLLSSNITIQRYKNVILPVVLYGCQTWSLSLKEELRMTLFKNRMLNEILALRWRNVKSHNEELLWFLLLAKYYWSNEIKEDEMWHVGGRRNVYNILVWKDEGNRMLGRHRWENNIKLYLRNRWVWTTWFRIGTVCCSDPLGSIKWGEFLHYLRTY